MVTSTISWPELVWTCVTFIGLVFCARLALRAAIDLVSLRARKINSIREYAAITTVIAFGSWTATQAIFVVAGIAAMLGHNHGVSASQVVVVSLFIVGTISLSLASYTVDKRRAALTEKIMKIEEGIND